MDVCLYAGLIERLITRRGVDAVTSLKETLVEQNDLDGLYRLRLAMEIVTLRREDQQRADEVAWARADGKLRRGYERGRVKPRKR